MFLVYSLILSVGVILTAPYYLWRARGRIFSASDWRERLGFLPPGFHPRGQTEESGAVWIHAVSVGETLAVAGLACDLQREFPERRIYLSSVTRAGREVGESRLPGLSGHFHLPLDLPSFVRRAIQQVRPSLLVIAETELWPNLLRAAHENGTHVILVNARLSNRSFRGYSLVKPFMKRVFACVDWIGAQTSQDAERFISLGARPEHVVVTGNLKFDGKPPQASPLANHLRNTLASANRSPVIVAASTMPDEEPMILQAWNEIRDQNKQAFLILAPRHPNRFDSVARMLSDAGRTFIRRTTIDLGFHDPGHLKTPEILLLDSIGELAGILDLADVVFVGGSLVATGGHNLLEAAYWGKPILFGPHMENFRDIARLFLESGAALNVHDQAELARAVNGMLLDDAMRKKLGEQANHLMKQRAGATKRTMEHIRTFLCPPVPTHSQI